jgi:hypothetical protein
VKSTHETLQIQSSYTQRYTKEDEELDRIFLPTFLFTETNTRELLRSEILKSLKIIGLKKTEP